MQDNILNQVYQVQSQLSKRGSRETFVAEHINTKERVIIKLLKFGFDAEWSDFKLFEREAHTLKNIEHSAIPKYLDYFELDLPDCKGFVLVQEYIAASSLEEIINTGRTFSELEIKQIGLELLNILVYLHQKQPSVIHRDIKPSNILLTDRSGNSAGQIYLIDFGAVKNIASSDGGTITVVGTYGYMPPEQFGGYATPATDIYSLGATLIYLATGRHPTELPSKDGKIDFAELVQLDRSLIKWLEKTIEPSCDRRFKSANEAITALQQPLVEDSNTESSIVRQPAFSKILMRKTAEEINVLIPAVGYASSLIPKVTLILFALFLSCILSIWTVGSLTIMLTVPDVFIIGLIMLVISIPFWILYLFMLKRLILNFFGSTKLIINSHQISLTDECGKIQQQKQVSTRREKISAIECKKHSSSMSIYEPNSEDGIYCSEVLIWANHWSYKLESSVKGNRIQKSAELMWLANELSQWLDIPLTYKK